MFFFKKSGGALDFGGRSGVQMTSNWVQFRYVCALEAMRMSFKDFNMIFCALKRSHIIFYEHEKKLRHWVRHWEAFLHRIQRSRLDFGAFFSYK